MPARPIKVISLQHPNAGSPSSSSSALSSRFYGWVNRTKRMTLVEWIELLVPCSRWIRIYNWREYFQIDLMAGITVGVMLVPQEKGLVFIKGNDIVSETRKVDDTVSWFRKKQQAYDVVEKKSINLNDVVMCSSPFLADEGMRTDAGDHHSSVTPTESCAAAS